MMLDQRARQSAEAARAAVANAALRTVVPRRSHERLAFALALGLVVALVGAGVWAYRDAEGSAPVSSNEDVPRLGLPGPPEGYDLAAAVALPAEEKEATSFLFDYLGPAAEPFVVAAHVAPTSGGSPNDGRRVTIRGGARAVVVTRGAASRLGVSWTEGEVDVLLLARLGLSEEALLEAAESAIVDPVGFRVQIPGFDRAVRGGPAVLSAAGSPDATGWFVAYGGRGWIGIVTYATESDDELAMVEFWSTSSSSVTVRGRQATEFALDDLGAGTDQRALIWSEEAGTTTRMLWVPPGDGSIVGPVSLVEFADTLIEIDDATWQRMVEQAEVMDDLAVDEQTATSESSDLPGFNPREGVFRTLESGLEYEIFGGDDSGLCVTVLTSAGGQADCLPNTLGEPLLTSIPNSSTPTVLLGVLPCRSLAEPEVLVAGLPVPTDDFELDGFTYVVAFADPSDGPVDFELRVGDGVASPGDPDFSARLCDAG